MAYDAILREDVAPKPSGWRGTFRSLRHRNYRLYFFGQMVSLCGSWMQMTALMWLAFELTHESTWPAAISASQILPTFVLGAWGGALADRWPKRRLIMATQTYMAACALALTVVALVGTTTPWPLLIVTALAGVAQAIDLPTRMAFVTDMVGRDDVMNAVALNSVMFNVARIIGPALGVALLFWVGPAWCFLFNALSYLAVLAALAAMEVAEKERPPEVASWRRLFAGFGTMSRQPALLLLVLAAGATALCGWPFMALLPAFAEHQLLLPKLGYGIMLSGTGVGALAAGLLVATFGTLERRRRFIGTGVTVVTVALFGLSLTTDLLAATVLAALVGFGLILFFSTGQAVMQLSADDHNRGQLMGIWAMVLSGGVPLGNLIVGPAADRWGVPLALRGQAIVCGGAALTLMVLRQVWRARRASSARPAA